MVEPLASSVLNSLIPRHVMKQTSSSISRAVNASRRVSFASNFFIPIPRQDKGKARAIDEPLLDEVLVCQSWASSSSSNQSVWSPDGVMRSVMLDELEEPHTPGRRIRRTSQLTRKRFHRPLCSSLQDTGQSSSGQHVHFLSSIATSSIVASSEDNSSLGPQHGVPSSADHYARPSLDTSFLEDDPACISPATSFLPTSYLETHPEQPVSTIQLFLNHLRYHEIYPSDLNDMEAAYIAALQDHAFALLSLEEAKSVLSLLGKRIDMMCVKQVYSAHIKKWGSRMTELYECLSEPVKETLNNSPEGHSFKIRSWAFTGAVQRPEVGLAKLLEDYPRSEVQRLYLETMTSYLLARARLSYLYHALDFWACRKLEGGPIPSSRSLFGKLVATVSDIEHIFKHAGQWKEPGQRPEKLEAITTFLLMSTSSRKNISHSLYIIGQMKKLGLTPPGEAVLVVCKDLAAAGRLDRAQLEFSNVDPCSNRQFWAQTKLYLHGRAGETEMAEQALGERVASGESQPRDACNVFMALGRKGQLAEMKEHFNRVFPINRDERRSPSPNAQIYTICIAAHARAGDVESINWWLQDMEKTQVEPDIAFFTTLMTFFKSVGDDQSLMLTYRRMLATGIRPDPSLYSVMLSHFANRKDCKGADAIFVHAIKQGCVPDEQMYRALLNVHIQSGSWQEANRIFQHLVPTDSDQRPSIETYNIMMKGHVLAGAPFSAMAKLFEQTKKLRLGPDKYTYATMLLSACEAGKMDIATEIFSEVKKKHGSRQKLLTPHILTIMMKGYLRVGDLDRARPLLNMMTEMGMTPSSVTYNALVASVASNGKHDVARSKNFIKTLLSKGSHQGHERSDLTGKKQPLANIYVPLMATAIKNRDVGAVERLYEEFLEAGGQPSISIYHHLLQAYRIGDYTEQALKLWPLIYELAERESFALEDENKTSGEVKTHMANIQAPLSIYLDIISKAGMHSKIPQVWLDLQERGVQFDTQNWNHLVVALIRAGEVESAFEVMDRVFIPNNYFNAVNEEVIKESNRSLPSGGMKAGYKKTNPLVNFEIVWQGNPMWGSDNRTRIANVANRRSFNYTQGDIDNDFTYPMRVLEFIRPGYDDWVPHVATMRALLMTCLQLERGYPPKPFEPGADTRFNVTLMDVSDRNPAFADKLVAKLRENFPSTLAKIQEFRLEELKRLHGRLFERAYLKR